MDDEHDFTCTSGSGCEECGRAWDQARERWRVYLTPDQQPETVAYCPECAQREFGD